MIGSVLLVLDILESSEFHTTLRDMCQGSMLPALFQCFWMHHNVLENMPSPDKSHSKQPPDFI